MQDFRTRAAAWASPEFLSSFIAEQLAPAREPYGLLLGRPDSTSGPIVIEEWLPAHELVTLQILVEQWAPERGRPMQGAGIYVWNSDPLSREVIALFQSQFRGPGGLLLQIGSKGPEEANVQILAPTVPRPRIPSPPAVVAKPQAAPPPAGRNRMLIAIAAAACFAGASAAFLFREARPTVPFLREPTPVLTVVTQRPKPVEKPAVVENHAVLAPVPAAPTSVESATFVLPVRGVKSIVPPPMVAIWTSHFKDKSEVDGVRRRSNGARLELPERVPE